MKINTNPSSINKLTVFSSTNFSTTKVSGQTNVGQLNVPKASVGALKVDENILTTAHFTNDVEFKTVTASNELNASGHLTAAHFTAQTVNADVTTTANITTENFSSADINCNILNTSVLNADSIDSKFFTTKTLQTVDFQIKPNTAYTKPPGNRFAASQIKNGQIDVIANYLVQNNTTSTFSDLQLADGPTGPTTLYIYGTAVTPDISRPIITSYNPQLANFDNNTGFGGIPGIISLYSPSTRTLRYDEDGHLRIYSNPNTIFWQTTNLVSDTRQKENIEVIQGAGDILSQLNGVYYKYKTDDISIPRRAGFIAQEVEKVLPECVVKPATAHPNLSIQYENFIPVLVQGVKELAYEFNEQLKKK